MYGTSLRAVQPTVLHVQSTMLTPSARLVDSVCLRVSNRLLSGKRVAAARVDASRMFRIVLVAFGSFLLWSVGTIFFDLVHWILHALLRSRWRFFRSLARPH